jgi:tetratricopeptide (TPR) repeat protein
MPNTGTNRRWIWLVLLALGVAVWAYHPLRSLWFQRTARHALLDGDAERAGLALEEALRSSPRSPEIHLQLARVARRRGHLQPFLDHLQQAQDFGLPPDRAQREQLLLQAQAGNMEQVEPHMAQLLRRDATDLNEVCAAIVAGYVHNYEFGPAFRYLEAWEKDFPEDPEPHIMRARIRQSWHNVREAERELRQALALRPTWRGLPQMLAQVLTEQNRMEEAAEVLSQVARQQPDDNHLQLAWADCLIRTGRIPEAKTLFERLESSEPTSVELLFGLGRIDLWEGQTERGLERLTRARDLDPQRNDVRYAYAQALAQAGQIDEARTEREAVERSTRAQARIFELSEQLVKTPQDLETRLEIGRTLLAEGDAEGVAWLETILRFDPQHREAHAALADYFESRQDLDRAQRHRQQTEATSPDSAP